MAVEDLKSPGALYCQIGTRSSMARTSKPSKVDRYWRQFQESLPPGVPRTAKYDWVFYFGSKRFAPALADLVVRGTKTATASLKWEYDAKKKAIPKAGDRSVITDGAGNPVCVIEDTEIRVLPFDEVDEAFAYDGGEGNRSLAAWRKDYWEMIVRDCARLHRRPTRKTPLVCERFRVVYREPPSSSGIAARAPGAATSAENLQAGSPSIHPR